MQETPKKKSRKAVYCTPAKTAKSTHSAFGTVQLPKEISSDQSFRPRSSSPAPKAKVGTLDFTMHWTFTGLHGHWLASDHIS